LQKVRQEFHNHHEHCGAREEEGQMSGMQGNQRRPAIRVVLREDVSKELSFLTVRGGRRSVPLAAGKFWFAVVVPEQMFDEIRQQQKEIEQRGSELSCEDLLRARRRHR
jgi:hypothetical protein